MDCTFCRQAEIAGQAAQEELSDFTSAPVGLTALKADDEAFELGGQLVGVAHGPPGAVAEGLIKRLRVLPTSWRFPLPLPRLPLRQTIGSG